MATDLGTETVTVNTQERTWLTQIQSPLGGMPSVVASRETVRTAADGTVIGQEAGITVQRSFDQVTGDSVTLESGKVITGLEMAQAIPLFIDKWRGVDKAAAAAAAAAAAQLQTPA